MKFFTLLLALLAVAAESRKPTFTISPAALTVRGGGELGPLDSALAMQLSKTAATAYVAGSASKYIAAQTGGSSGQVRSDISDGCCVVCFNEPYNSLSMIVLYICWMCWF